MANIQVSAEMVSFLSGEDSTLGEGVILLKDNGTKSTYLYAADTDAARGDALDLAIAAAAAGDHIILGPGTFDTSITLPADVAITGAGIYRTIVTAITRTDADEPYQIKDLSTSDGIHPLMRFQTIDRNGGGFGPLYHCTLFTHNLRFEEDNTWTKLRANEPAVRWGLEVNYNSTAAKPITSSTAASPAVITATAHGFNDGDVIYIWDHTTIPDGLYTVANATTDTFTVGVNTVSIGAGGYAVLESAGNTVHELNLEVAAASEPAGAFTFSLPRAINIVTVANTGITQVGIGGLIGVSGASAAFQIADRDGAGSFIIYNQSDTLRFYDGANDLLQLTAGALTLPNALGNVSIVAGQGLQTSRDTFYYCYNTARIHDFNAGAFQILANGSVIPASLADASAANGTIYYSTTAGKLVYKDSGGVVNNLY